MSVTIDCPPASILHAVATGRVPEPLLGMYLGHVESCDDCCSRIERITSTLDRFAPSEETLSEKSSPDGWLAGLKLALPPRGAEEAAIGRRIGPFRLTAELGRGGSAIVYAAVDEDLDRPVVLKILRSAEDNASSSAEHRLVVAEARALASLNHECIMPLLQLRWHDGSPVIVFPRLEGETLAAALAAGRVGPSQSLGIVRDIVSGLAYVHGRGIFHYDIKPSNIWLVPRADGKVSAMLFDFGLIGAADVVVGTPGYSDPDTSVENEPAARDMFSLGVVLHECLGRSPDAPVQYRSLVARLTAADPSVRPTAAQVLAELHRAFERRSRLAPLVLMLLLILVGVVVSRSFIGNGPSRSPVNAAVAGGPIEPQRILPGYGLPVAVSGDGLAVASVTDGPAVSIRSLEDAVGPKRISLDFRPDRLAFNESYDRLAATDAIGNLAIMEIGSDRVSMTHRFEEGISWMGWSGWNRNAVVILSGLRLHGFFKTRKGPFLREETPEWVLQSLRGDVSMIASLPGSEAVISMDVKGEITMWSVGGLSEDIVVRPAPSYSSDPVGKIIGWKSRGVGFVANDGSVTELSPHTGIESYQVASPLRSIVWPNESMPLTLSGTPGERQRLLLTDRKRPEWSCDLALGEGECESITLLDDRRRVAVIASDGGIRIYALPSQP